MNEEGREIPRDAAELTEQTLLFQISAVVTVASAVGECCERQQGERGGRRERSGRREREKRGMNMQKVEECAESGGRNME